MALNVKGEENLQSHPQGLLSVLKKRQKTLGPRLEYLGTRMD